MKALLNHLRSRPALYVAVAVGVLAAWAAPTRLEIITRTLIGWDVGVWLYLLSVWVIMVRADHHRLRQIAAASAESAIGVTSAVALATAASIAAIVLELATAKAGGDHAATNVLFTLFTVASSWLLLPTLFALTYASLYYGSGKARHGGLSFPKDDEASAPAPKPPHYADFMYFSYTIAVACQTSDVSITSTRLRRLVLAHSVLSFVFNTAIVALMVNIAAGLV